MEDSMATHIEQHENEALGMTQTLIWLGVMLVGVVAVAYFYI
jgi:hypothetical protein